MGASESGEEVRESSACVSARARASTLACVSVCLTEVLRHRARRTAHLCSLNRLDHNRLEPAPVFACDHTSCDASCSNTRITFHLFKTSHIPDLTALFRPMVSDAHNNAATPA
eukprot:6213588-Pleurochrysis_carterae.AAC.2